MYKHSLLYLTPSHRDFILAYEYAKGQVIGYRFWTMDASSADSVRGVDGRARGQGRNAYRKKVNSLISILPLSLSWIFQHLSAKWFLRYLNHRVKETSKQYPGISWHYQDICLLSAAFWTLLLLFYCGCKCCFNVKAFNNQYLVKGFYSLKIL